MRQSSPRSTLTTPVAWLATALFIACGDSVPVGPEAPAEIAFDAVSAKAAGPGADDWIVVFQPGVADAPGLARQLLDAHGGTLRFTYQHALQGFAATLPGQAVEAIRGNPNVAYVEADLEVSIVGSGTDGTPGSWGLDRVDQRSGRDGSYTWNDDGTGVHAYVIDTGVLPTHVDFGGRASADFDAVGGGQNGVDCHGHGTHVAGTVGGREYGIAKSVWIHGVRVLNCAGSGTTAGVIAGIDWVTANHVKPAVANMSLGGGYSQSLNDAVANSVAAGVTYAVAAGNETTDACVRSPASAPEALTVGSTTSTDGRSSFSNYGTCVDLFAPGSSITSAWIGADNTSTRTISGTSMASPHVAGVAALRLDLCPNESPAEVAAAITGGATAGVVSNEGPGSPDLLLYSLLSAACGSGGGSGGGGGGDPVSGGTISVADVSAVTLAGGKHKSGSVVVTVEASDGQVATVQVTGDWFKNGGTSPSQTSAGTTDTDGTATLSTSGEIKGASTLQFCVTGLAKSGYTDATDYAADPVCSAGSGGGGGGGGGDLPAAPLDDLAAQTQTNNGGKTKVALSWSAWAVSPVDIWRGSGVIATVENTGSYTDNRGSTGDSYRVCQAGSTDAAACTNWADAP
jgi:subtilisin family serine protease